MRESIIIIILYIIAIFIYYYIFALLQIKIGQILKYAKAPTRLKISLNMQFMGKYRQTMR